MHHQGRDDTLSFIQIAFCGVHSKAGVDIADDSLPIHSKDESLAIKIRWGAGKELKHITGKSLRSIPPQRAGMPELVKARRIRVVIGTILH